MKKKIVFGGIGGIFLAIAGFVLYDMSEMEIEVLILCSSNEGGIRIPSGLCHYYMVNYRINEKDIEALSEGAGLDYILHAKPPKRYEIAKAFLARGLDVNGVSHYSGLTPLQAAALGNDVQSVKFLLAQGAGLQIHGELGMTALEYAKKIHKAGDKFRDKGEIIQILSDAEKR
ncbi:MAG: ankyrin repeat domain-containing protein [Gammaproteobacteria bacterium]|nr:ankyrin repeat domain-containing protein [Gammaproteobacteria bacterium]